MASGCRCAVSSLRRTADARTARSRAGRWAIRSSSARRWRGSCWRSPIPRCWPRCAVPREGVVHLVGAGPGDPGLLTRRGEALLRRAEVVVYDRLAAPELLNLCGASAQLVYVGKEAGADRVSQDE